jgi:Cu-processing system ATP-binding protein
VAAVTSPERVPPAPPGASDAPQLVTSTAAIVEVRDLAKSFGGLTVLDGVSTTVGVGRITAVVGPNAAGKSTLIKTILGLVRPDAGRIIVNGHVVTRDWDYRRGIGYMPQASHFPENLTGREVLSMLKHLRGPSAELDEELLDAFALGPQLGKQIRTLSGGTRQKLNAVIAFLFRPPLLILDEPTAGLDPVASGIIKEKILRCRESGTSVVLTSHIMSEIEALADTVVFLLDGRVQFDGPRLELQRLTGHQGLERAIAALMQGAGS